ncbi:ImmA/IrrE family metallo-endopeptidase [Lactococcus petauri]|uniref:ImmA/IrrE family metallo-endopeptidase n=1 Tax=Lactococcus petauri TaxID=1940789 RepID=UPI002570A7C8|nr:ImmA/IrrE family metallo-endopeptidase [Lactococcus petauri]WJE12726.1 ImmA/IrrE family metallo-endopeptidase [Lactococcus petauri]
MASIEYRKVSASSYKKYMEMASMLLDDIASYSNKKKKYIIYSDIISYFENTYDILFTFFEVKKNNKIIPSTDLIKHRDLVRNEKFKFLDDDIASKISGVTIPNKHNNKIIIMLNQVMPKQRIIFTILHELVHLHFHNTNQKKHLIFASKFSGVYPSEMIPFEDEANVIASLLFCSTEQLETFLLRKSSFSYICSQTCMSKSALHNRLLNYFQHILTMNYQQALNYVLRLREGEKKAYYEIKIAISHQKQNIISNKTFIKMSNGLTVKKSECTSTLQNKNIQELILELEYAHSTNNFILERLVMEEYYKKVK